MGINSVRIESDDPRLAQSSTLPDDISYNYEYILTNNSLCIIRIDEQSGNIETITTTDKNILDYIKIVLDNYTLDHDYYLQKVFNENHIPTKINLETFGNINVDQTRGVMYYKCPVSGEEVKFSHRLYSRVLNAIDDADNEDKQSLLNGLLNFAEKLATCEDTDIVYRLYDFIEPNNIIINSEGNVICYKKVNGNFKDIYTGSIDNSVGTTVRVNRNKVDSNHNETCSYGLHVCSKDYLQYYSRDDSNVVVVVEVDPVDFVAIPYDYDDAKARVCKYKVIDTYTDDTVMKQYINYTYSEDDEDPNAPYWYHDDEDIWG